MTDQVRHGLLAAYRVLMQPLVRILVRHGVSYNEFNEVLKSVFVEVAERDFGIPGRKPSQSRVAILTGLTRKEVAKQKAILDGDAELRQGCDNHQDPVGPDKETGSGNQKYGNTPATGMVRQRREEPWVVLSQQQETEQTGQAGKVTDHHPF